MHYKSFVLETKIFSLTRSISLCHCIALSFCILLNSEYITGLSILSEDGTKIYTNLTSRLYNHTDGQTACKHLYNANLALIKNQEDLEDFSKILEELLNPIAPEWATPFRNVNELWVGGKTDLDVHVYINISDPSQIPKQSGSRCVISSNYNGGDVPLTSTYNLYAKDCGERRRIICGKDISDHFFGSTSKLQPNSNINPTTTTQDASVNDVGPWKVSTTILAVFTCILLIIVILLTVVLCQRIKPSPKQVTESSTYEASTMQGLTEESTYTDLIKDDDNYYQNVNS